MPKGCPRWKYQRLDHSEHVKDLTTPKIKLFSADNENAKDLTIAKMLKGAKIWPQRKCERLYNNESSKDSAITTVKSVKDWVD